MAYSEFAGLKLTKAEKRSKRSAIRHLHDAVNKNDVSLVKELMNPDLDVDFHYNGQTALQIAVLNGFEDVCRVLINNGADVNKYNAENNNLLNMAAWRDFSNIVQLLVSHGTELNMSNNHGSTPLNTAAYRGYPTIVQILLDGEAFIDKPNSKQQSPLLVSSKRGHYQVAKLLIEGECDLNWPDSERKSPLIAAAHEGHSRIVQLLVDAGCDLNMREKYGCTALLLASRHGHGKCVEILINAGAKIDICDTKSQSPFFEAVKGQHLEIVDMLAGAGCNVNAAEHDYDYAPIHVAIREACQFFGRPDTQMSMVKKLIGAGCDLNLADKSGWTPLHQTCFGGEKDITRLLLDEKVYLNVANELGDTPLHGAMFGNKVTIVEMLIEKGANLNQVNKKNQTPLYTAVTLRGNLEIIRLLLASGSDVNICENEHHQSPLFAALQHEYIEVVQVLVSAGCDINLPNSKRDSPLYVASEKGLEDMVDLLLKQPGIKVDAGKKHLPLHGAAGKGFFTIAEKLLIAGARVNMMTDTCQTALWYAADCNHLNIAQLLIKYGANPSIHHKVPGPWKCCVFYADNHPHLELEAIYNAVKNDNFDMLRLVLAATAKMPYYSLRTLKDIVFRTGYLREARLKPKVIVQFAEFFTRVCHHPRSLQQECRGVVLSVLGLPSFKTVPLLPLPAKLKDYLLLRDLIPEVIRKDEDDEGDVT